MIVLGDPGVGKTVFSRDVATLLINSGILIGAGNRKITEPKTSDFIASYEGQSEYLSYQTMLNSLETVIFVDEIYKLAKCNKTSDESKKNCEEFSPYSISACSEINEFIGNFPSCLVMIGAGYESSDNPVENIKNSFLAINQGLRRRFPIIIKIKNIDAVSAVKKIEDTILSIGYKISEDGKEAIRTFVENKYEANLEFKENFSSVSEFTTMLVNSFAIQKYNQDNLSQFQKAFLNQNFQKINDQNFQEVNDESITITGKEVKKFTSNLSKLKLDKLFKEKRSR